MFKRLSGQSGISTKKYSQEGVTGNLNHLNKTASD